MVGDVFGGENSAGRGVSRGSVGSLSQPYTQWSEVKRREREKDDHPKRRRRRRMLESAMSEGVSGSRTKCR
jgi:hypothetical protein